MTFVSFLKNCFTELTCETPSLISANRKVRAKIGMLLTEGISNDDSRRGLPFDKVMTYVKDDLDRLRSIEDKARVTVIGITLSLSIFFTGIGLVINFISMGKISQPYIVYIFCILTFGAALYFLIAGFSALKVLEVKGIYHYSLEDEVQLVDSESRVLRLLCVLELNRKLITIYSNFTDVSYKAVRNGLICTVLIIIGFSLSICSNLIEDLDPRPPNTKACVQKSNYRYKINDNPSQTILDNFKACDSVTSTIQIDSNMIY